MKLFRGSSRVLWYESAGFLILIGLSWANEIQGLSQMMFGGGPHMSDWRDSALQTIVIVYVWAIVWGLTRILVQRLHDLGTYLRLCAWCRKVGHRGKWVKIEEYFRNDFRIPTTHGMCLECRKRMEEETAQFRKANEERAIAEVNSET